MSQAAEPLRCRGQMSCEGLNASFLGNWQALTAIAAMVTALGAFASVGFIFHQTRQQRKFEAFWELYREWDSPQMRAHRRRAAALLQRKDLMTNHELVTADVDVVLDFFDTVAMLVRRRVLDKRLVWLELPPSNRTRAAS